jgi:cysteinyl-tRNA synthetase
MEEEKKQTATNVETLRQDLLSSTKSDLELINSARKEKNFTLADEIREKLLTSGVKLEDTKDGTSFNFIV